MEEHNTNADSRYVIALVDAETIFSQLTSCFNDEEYSFMHFDNGIDLTNKWTKNKLSIAAIISNTEIMGPSGISLYQTLQKKKFPSVPFFIVSGNTKNSLMQLALEAGITDVFAKNAHQDCFHNRIDFIIRNWPALNNTNRERRLQPYKLPLAKRAFDILFSSLALLMLSPVLLAVIIAIRLESKGPVFYYALRVGTGYRTFKFYKFRSMYTNADKRLKDLQHLNQYSNSATPEEAVTAAAATLCDECAAAGTQCRMQMYADKNAWCEKQYSKHKKATAGSAFFKLKNDPRITKVGKLLRNTSMDELPQLVNVLIGDMSIVGNRPLPLYEAEKLTTDKYAQRFIAPAGITGLWQVEKRGKGEMSEEERLMLDNTYAKNHSFFNDIRLICKTIPALFQKENV